MERVRKSFTEICQREGIAHDFRGMETFAGDSATASLASANAADLAGTAAITVTRTSEVVRVEVRAVLPSIVPGIELPVRGFAESPIERFRSEVEP